MARKIRLSEQAEEILRIAEEKGVQENFFFITTFKRYQVQIQMLNDLEKSLKENGTLITKEYVKGRKNLYDNPAINAYNRIEFLPNENRYIPLNYSNSRMDGKLPNVFLADEVGALPNSYAIEAMRSGQLNILNKLGCIISTKYPTANNPFEDEVNYAKRVLDGTQADDTAFSLLYEPERGARAGNSRPKYF